MENIPESAEDSKVDEVVQQQGAEPESAEESVDTAVLPTASELEHAAEDEKLNGHEGDVKVPGVPKNPVDTQATGLYSLVHKFCCCFTHNIYTYSSVSMAFSKSG